LDAAGFREGMYVKAGESWRGCCSDRREREREVGETVEFEKSKFPGKLEEC
jgi:hypothetical protein